MSRLRSAPLDMTGRSKERSDRVETSDFNLAPKHRVLQVTHLFIRHN
jgi:hypothetical protein